MQVAVIEYARNVVGLTGANSSEFDSYTPHPVIDLMPEQLEVKDLGGSMRLGNWPMKIMTVGTTLNRIFTIQGNNNGIIHERHRHRYEVSPGYVPKLEKAGLSISGVTPGVEGRGEGLVEAIELEGHIFFIGLQSHPELASRLSRPSPPFRGFIEAALKLQKKRKQLVSLFKEETS